MCSEMIRIRRTLYWDKGTIHLAYRYLKPNEAKMRIQKTHFLSMPKSCNDFKGNIQEHYIKSNIIMTNILLREFKNQKRLDFRA